MCNLYASISLILFLNTETERDDDSVSDVELK